MGRHADYFKDDDAILSQGTPTSKIRPLTLEEKVKALIKFHKQFTLEELYILATYCASKENYKYTIDMHEISQATLYRLISKAKRVFSQT